jgi:hypothetical protein
MVGEEFVALFRGYWPNARNVAAPRQQEMWAETLYGIPDDVIAYAMRRYARSAEHPPTVLQFEKYIWPLMDAWSDQHPMHSLASAWRRRMQQLAQSENERVPPVSRDCETCGAAIRFEAPPVNRRFASDGGLMFREHAGQWFAARCPQCGGPELRRVFARRSLAECPLALPVPRPGDLESGVWRPVRATPGGPLLAAGQGLCRALKLAFHAIGSASKLTRSVHPVWDLYFDWERAAIQNTRAAIESGEGPPWAPRREPGEDPGLPLSAPAAPAAAQAVLALPAPPVVALEPEPELGDEPPF